MKFLKRLKKILSNQISPRLIQLAISFLPRLYREEFEYFESIRKNHTNDQKYYFTHLRKNTHLLEKAIISGNKKFVLTKKEHIKRLLNKINPYEQKSEYQQICWVKDVLNAAEKNNSNIVIEKNKVNYGKTNELEKALYNRRSIREYTDQEIPKEKIYKILESGLWAPSGCNKQPIEYLFITAKDDIRFCKNLAGEGSAFPMKAKFIVIILVDTRNYTLPIERHMVYLDAGACIQNILIMSYKYGIGTCWLFWNDRKAKNTKFWDRFNVHPWFLPVSMICFGYPKNVPIAPQRKRLKNFLSI